MKIFVTGITGFIGSNIWEFFNSSDEIYVLTRKTVEFNHPKVRVIEGDLNTPENVFNELRSIKPDICIHLAWEGIPDFSYERSLKNLLQGLALLRCLVEECGCRKIIIGGSCFEYGTAFGPCLEDKDMATNSYFVWAKHALYDFGKLLAVKYPVSIIWFRLFYVYGPGQRIGSLVPTLADALAKGEAPPVKTPLNANDFVYVKDIAEALVMAVRKTIPTGIYNLGAGTSVPVWKVCEMLEEIMGQTLRYSNEMKTSSVHPSADFWADTSKVKAVLGWSPRTSFREGLTKYISKERDQ